ncbi:MAG TPA: site-2 protease family protein [Anaerolineales bacterium]|jgi:Zn-dependent protease
MLFAEPASTPYDLRFNVGPIPVRVHPLFWLIAVLFGASAGGILELLIWVAVIFVSILIHELGHVVAFRRYGQAAKVVLHMGGGLAVPEPVSWGGRWANVELRPSQAILISLAGPAAGFLFAALVLAVAAAVGGIIIPTFLFGFIPFPEALVPGGAVPNLIVHLLLWVNIFWGLVNLLPVYPLDGGNVARRAWISLDPLDGGRKSLWLSVITGAVVALAGLLFLHSVYMALLFGFLAFQSYQTLSGRSFGGY